MASEKFRPQIKLRAPTNGLVSWFTLSRLLFHFLFQARYRLEIEGAEGSSQTGKGLRFKVEKGGSSSPPSSLEEGKTSTGSEGMVSCTICPNTAVLTVKKTVTCGRAVCCGPIVPGRDTAETEYVGKIVTTEVRTVYDRTGPGSSLVTYDCTGVSSVDYNPTGSGYAAGACSDGTPDCGTTETTGTGCEGIPLCGDLPGPGQKCYFVKSINRTYSKICTQGSSLTSKAQAAASTITDTDYTADIADSMGSAMSMAADGEYSQVSWEFKQKGSRYPVHVILEILERGVWEGPEILTEEIISLDAATSTGVYVLAAPSEGRFRRINSVEVVYGKLP